MEQICLKIDEQDVGKRIDKALDDLLVEVSRARLQKMLSDGQVFVNGKVVKKSYKVALDDEICAILPPLQSLDATPENIEINIVYEDDHLLVVNKPKGLVVHPAPGHESHTLVNALLYHCDGRLSSINGVIRPGIVHRIDMDTSGLLVVAKNDLSHNFLAEQIKEHTMHRCYHAIVYGNLKNDEGVIDAPIGRHKTDRKKMSVSAVNGKNAVTHYKVLERFPGYTYIECRLETGRTHQIRVHMASIGHGVVGDPVYGVHPKNEVSLSFEGQCLHAKELGFIHPTGGEAVKFDSELPDYFLELLEKLRKL